MKTKTTILSIYILLVSNFISGQIITTVSDVNIQPNANLWSITSNKTSDAGAYSEIEINSQVLNNLIATKPQNITLQIKDENDNDLNIELTLQNIGHIPIKINNLSYVSNIITPLNYKGKVGAIKEKHDVMLTLAPNYIALQALLPTQIIAIEKENNPNTKRFLFSNSKLLKLPSIPFSCGLGEPPVSEVSKAEKIPSTNYRTRNLADKCVYVFVDCTDSLYFNRGSSIQNTVNYIYTIWNDVRTAFNNEQLNVKISEINVWTTTTPFNLTTKELGNQTFAGFYQDNYVGNMAMLLDWSTGTIKRAGIAGGYGVAKNLQRNIGGNYNPDPQFGWNWGSFIYMDLNYGGNYQNFPTMPQSRQVYACVHEIGHLLGAYHTHWCGWPGGAIDNCEDVEGSCSMGPEPTNGGTFMSYCIGYGEFVNFNNGFGTLPGDTIRNFVDNNILLEHCEACHFINFDLALPTIPPGVQLYEASNLITSNAVISGNGNFVTLDAGNKVILNPGFKATVGSRLKVFTQGCGGIE